MKKTHAKIVAESKMVFNELPLIIFLIFSSSFPLSFKFVWPVSYDLALLKPPRDLLQGLYYHIPPGMSKGLTSFSKSSIYVYI